MISCGQKDIEMRLYDEKRRKINVGDTIEFTNKKTNQKMEVIVINLHIYDSFEMLYSKFEKTRLGYKKDEIEMIEFPIDKDWIEFTFDKHGQTLLSDK